MKKLFKVMAVALGLMLLPLAAHAQIVGPTGPGVCANPTLPRYSVSITGTASSQLVTGNAAQRIHVCDFYWSNASAGTAQLEYGTGSTCGTGTTALTGAMTGSLPFPVMSADGNDVLKVPSVSQNLCVILGGTSPSVAGFLTYVLQ